MTALTARLLDETYIDLLQVSNSNAGIDSTLRTVGDGEDTGSVLQLSTTGARLGGVAFFVPTDGADVTSALTAFVAAVATNAVIFITDPGTYTVSGADLSSYAFRLVGGPGVIFRQKASATAAMLTVGSNTTIEGIEFDGLKASQSADHQGIYSNNPTNLTVQRCKFTSFYFHPIHVDDGTRVFIDDNYIADSRATAVQFFTKTSAGCTKCYVRRNIIDRSANDTGTGGGVKFTYSAGSGHITECEIVDNDITLHAAASITDYVCAEMWGSAGTINVIRCLIARNKLTGGEIGASMDSPIDSQIAGNIIYNAEDIGAEIVRPVRTAIRGNTINGNGSTDKGAVVDCQATTLEGNSVCDNIISGFTSKGVHIIGSGSGRPDRTTISDNNINSSTNDAEGISILTAQRAKATGNTIKLTGTGGYGIVAGTGADGLTANDNDVGVTTGLACIRSADNNNITIKGNSLTSLSGTTATGYDIVNATNYEVTGGTITGTFTTGCDLKADGSGKTTDQGTVGGWSGDGSAASINPTAANSGTFGTGNWAIPTPGWTPFGTITMALIRLATSFSDWFFVYGTRLGGTPTESVADGSRLTDDTNGIPYARISGAWAPWYVAP